MRLASATLCSIRLQFRHGFYYAYLVVCVVYVVLLYLLAGKAREIVTPLLIFSDPAMLGIFFIGGIVLLERSDNTLQSLFVTPLRTAEYCFAKVISLALLALSSSVILAAAGKGGIHLNWPLLVLGVILTSGLVTLTGLAVSARADTVPGYILSVIPLVIVISLPVLPYFGVLDSHWFYLIPTHASITLIQGGFSPGTAPLWELLLSLALLTAWNLAAWKWAERRFAVYLTGAALNKEPPNKVAPNKAARNGASEAPK